MEMRNFSFNAVHAFEDCSLDFVYVDAVHDYDGVSGRTIAAMFGLPAASLLRPCTLPSPRGFVPTCRRCETWLSGGPRSPGAASSPGTTTAT